MGASRGISPLWVIKIGGSIISTQNDDHYFNNEIICAIAKNLKIITQPIILIHGTGYISKSFALSHKIMNRKIKATDKKTAEQCMYMLREIHFTVLKNFASQGVFPVSISPFTFCKYLNNQIHIVQPQILSGLIKNGYIPLIHGDLILDEEGDFCICSSDELVASIIKLFPAGKLLFATDVPGVCKEDPKKYPGSRCFKMLNHSTLKQMAQLPYNGEDVSGAMSSKLKAISGVTKYFDECFIFNGKSMATWNSLIYSNKHVGTYIPGLAKTK